MSQKIDISNYEVHALDYLEGSLEPSLQEAFEAFLLVHPEIAEELESMRDLDLLEPNMNVSFDKNALKIQVSASGEIDESNYESFMIAELEGGLTNEEVQHLDSFVDQNPDLARDRMLYQKTRLSANDAVVFHEKSSLKRTIPLWENTQAFAYRAAAILLVALGGVTIWNMINDEVYIPRNRDLDYSLMESAPALLVPGERPVKSSTQDEFESDTYVEERIASTSGSQSARVDAPSTLPRKSASLNGSSGAAIAEREMLAYEPQISEWVGDPTSTSSSSQTLTLAQFVGKKVLGVDPKKAPTTKDVLREGFVNAIDGTDAMALSTTNPTDDKKKIEFLAGNFEFTRVRYK